MSSIRGTHHITMSVGGAQEDWDFHTKVLGLNPIKKTVLFDGKLPIYHLYYGNGSGEASTLLTSFPFRQAGIMGRRGSNQVKAINLAVPAGSLDYWADRLAEHGVAAEHVTRLGRDRVELAHPCGIPYALVGVAEPDSREPYESGGVPAEHGIRGAYGPTVSVVDAEEMVDYVVAGLGGEQVDEEDGMRAFRVGTDAGHGRVIELWEEPHVRPGTWRFAEGTVHHWAWDVNNPTEQQEMKDHLEGLGYTDVSERKDRLYFLSCYTRTPSGALFELAYSTPQGFTIDEEPDRLGSEFMLPPQFEDRREEIMAALEPLETRRVDV